MSTLTIAHGVTLARFPMLGGNPDSCGTVAHWETAVNQLFAQMPFRGLFNGLRLEIWDRTRADQPAELNGNAGLHYPGQRRIALAVNTPTPAIARQTLAHEFGHFYQSECGWLKTDPIRQKLKSTWEAMRPHQGHNSAEDWAEVYRATHGHDEVRGRYSDGKTAEIPATLYSLINCAYWLAGNAANIPVNDLNPISNGVMFQAQYPTGWHWRFISNRWQLQQYENGKWILI